MIFQVIFTKAPNVKEKEARKLRCVGSTWWMCRSDPCVTKTQLKHFQFKNPPEMFNFMSFMLHYIRYANIQFPLSLRSVVGILP